VTQVLIFPLIPAKAGTQSAALNNKTLSSMPAFSPAPLVRWVPAVAGMSGV
jgi:hypothetical protein